MIMMISVVLYKINEETNYVSIRGINFPQPHGPDLVAHSTHKTTVKM